MKRTMAEVFLTISELMGDVMNDDGLCDALMEVAGDVLSRGTSEDGGSHQIVTFSDGSVVVDYEGAYRDQHAAAAAIVRGDHR